jgi:AcrR family transcriptional regulator
MSINLPRHWSDLDRMGSNDTSDGSPAVHRLPGRPRSEPIQHSILEAALRLMAEKGYGALTMEGIAHAAPASKQTLYRWWPSKAAIALEALNDRVNRQVPAPDLGNLGADLHLFLSRTVDGMTPGMRRVLRGLMAEAQVDPAFGEAFTREFIQRRRLAFKAPFERALARGDIAPDTDVELLADLAFGTLWYRIMTDLGTIDQSLADELTAAILAATKRAVV